MGKELSTSDQIKMIEAKFSYSLFRKAFEKQTKQLKVKEENKLKLYKS